jgi:prepilin-type N-terminal cleavage/methylation domain-containing protein
VSQVGWQVLRIRPVCGRSEPVMRRQQDSGFTFVELLVVIVIIGILATIALPKYAATKEKALTSRMISDLRNVAVSEEAYFNDFAQYYGGVLPAAGLVFAPSDGNSVVINAANSTGWSATVSSTGMTRQCMVFFGTAAPLGAATTEGRSACTP